MIPDKINNSKTNTFNKIAISQPTIILNDFIFVKTDGKTIKLDFSDILFIESLKDYVAFHTLTEKLLVLETLKEIEVTLPSLSFVRIHKSYIVYINAIESIERNRVFLRKQIILPIGDTYRENFLNRIKIL